MKITMDGEYAYRNNPATKVRVLCVDGSRPRYPVVSMDAGGVLNGHTDCGKYFADDDVDAFDLVPLQKPVEAWVVVLHDGDRISFVSEASARKYAKSCRIPPARIVRTVEARE